MYVDVLETREITVHISINCLYINTITWNTLTRNIVKPKFQTLYTVMK